MNVNETVLDAIELLAKSKVEKADFDRTIQAQIISCEDAAAGKYRCRFQDAIIYAYSNSPDVTFSNGSFVYILVPRNDMTQEKTILGSVSRLGTDYLNQVDEESLYDIDGENCIIIDENFYLDTSNKDYKYVIYKHGEESDISLD
jgi:hypothetical protein